MLSPIARRIEGVLYSEEALEAFAKNPALGGLKLGAAFGLINGMALVLLGAAVVPEGRDLIIALKMLSGTFLFGMMLGGLAGLVCQGRKWGPGAAVLILASLDFGLLVFFGLIVAALEIS